MRLRTLGAAVAATAAVLTATSTADAANWLAPHDVTVGFNSQAGGAAIGPDGTVTTTALNASSGSQRALEVRVKRPGQPFGAPVQLSKPGSFVGFSRTLADRQGNVVVAWEEMLVDGLHVVRAATKTANGDLTPAQSVSDTGMSARWPAASIAGGKAVLAWAQGGRVRAATATAGSPFAVHDPLTAPIGFDDPPAVAVAPDGAAVVAWDIGGKVRAAARAAGGEFSPLPDVATAPSEVGEVQLAMSTTGRATLAWRSAAALQTASRAKTGTFGGVETVPGFTGDPAVLAMADDDTALLGWTNGGGMRYSLRPLGGGFGPLATVPGSTYGGHQAPRVAFGPDGSARVLWLGRHGGRDALETSRIASNGASEPAQIVSPPSEAPAGQNDSLESVLGLGVNDHGDAVASWMHSYDAAPGPAFDTRVRVRTSILDSTPPAVGAVRLEGSAVQGRSVAMSVTARDALSGATAIWSFGDGTTEEGESLTKVYSAPGVFTVRVTVTDSAGNATTVQRTVDVLARRT